MAGFIKLHRGWRDTDGLRKSAKFSEHEAWLWLLENAAWKDTHRRNHKGEEVAVARGELHTSERAMASAWGWSRKAVSTFIKRLETVNKVDTKRGQSGSHLSIVNYGVYQDNGASNGASLEPAGGQPRATQEEGKESKEEKKYAFAGRVVRLNFRDFARWRKAYPDLDLHALLNSRDDWLGGQSEADRKRWFQSTSSWLANKQQEATAQNRKNGSAGEIW